LMFLFKLMVSEMGLKPKKLAIIWYFPAGKDME